MPGPQPDSGDLCTYADLKGRLRLQNDDAQAVLQALITGASEDIRQEASRNFDIRSYDEFYSGSGVKQRQLWLRQWPIVSVSHLYVDGQEIFASVSGSPGYLIITDSQTGKIFLSGFYFSQGQDNIEVQYRAGYFSNGAVQSGSIPADLRQACVKLAMYRFKSDEWIGQKSKSLGGEVVSFVTDHMPDDVLRVIQRYKRVIPA